MSLAAQQHIVPIKPTCTVNQRYANTQFDTYSPSTRDMHSLLHSRPHSQSQSTLHKSNIQGSYTVIPVLPPASECSQHFYTGRCFAAHQQLPLNNGCCRYKVDAAPMTMGMPVGCMCSQAYKQYQTPPPPRSYADRNYTRKSYANGCYSGYELSNRLTDEEDSAFPALHDREFHILHRSIPALRRSGVDTTTIRQHYYPDGGWGWIICSVSFLVHILTSGLQLSYGLLLFYAIQHLQDAGQIEWLGALSWSVSMLVTPFVVTFCRKKSTRLLAVVGGLVVSLGILFTSFATEFGQILFSYGIVFGVGVAMVRESSLIILGNYFKKRRLFVEMVAMSGEGVGITLFSVILKEGVGKVGWRLGLQIIAMLVAINFFMGMLYRPASLYHPQRRAIQHLKNQRKKVREKKLPATTGNETPTKRFILDFTPLNSTTVKIILLTSSVASLGIYAPIFSMSINAAKEGSDVQDLVLLQTFLGMSTALGVVLAGSILRRPLKIRKKVVTTQVITQVFISTIAIAILFLSFVMGYRGLCILSWIYGIGFGGYRYSIKTLALERIKVKNFSKAWGLIKGAESIPVLISVPLTSFLNDYSLKYGRAGYYICSAAAAIAGITIFFITYTQTYVPNRKAVGNGRVSTARALPQHYKPAADYFYDSWDFPAPDLVHNSCISLNQPLPEPKTFRNTQQYEMSQLNTPRHLSGEQQRFGSLNRRVPQYHFGQGSVGARMGKRMQKSLSFIHYPCSSDSQWNCNCRQPCNWKLQQHQQQAQYQPLVCTCSPASQCNQSSKSRSVPEGLSSIFQECSCNIANTMRMSNYLSRTPSQSLAMGCSHCAHAQQHSASTAPEGLCRRQRSQSWSKPLQYVEQITTSV